MRRLFSDKPGATFNESLPTTTINVRKDFVNMMIDICNELSHNPPFPAWKDGLNELWN